MRIIITLAMLLVAQAAEAQTRNRHSLWQLGDSYYSIWRDNTTKSIKAIQVTLEAPGPSLASVKSGRTLIHGTLKKVGKEHVFSGVGYILDQQCVPYDFKVTGLASDSDFILELTVEGLEPVMGKNCTIIGTRQIRYTFMYSHDEEP